MRDAEVPVLVVGGGLAGLSTAVCLAWQGIPSMVVEKHPGSTWEPKVRMISPRAMEVFRRVGVEDRIRAVRSAIEDRNMVVFAESMAADEVARRPAWVCADFVAVSPCGWARIDQNPLEDLLRDTAVDRGVDFRRGTEMTGFDERPDGVLATLVDRRTRVEYRVLAGHLVAADGGRSPVRRRLGIGKHGPDTLATIANIFFRADLREPLRGRNMLLMVVETSFRGTLMPMDNEKCWRLTVQVARNDQLPVSYFTERRCVELVRSAVGVADLPVVIERTPSSYWDISGQVADRWQAGRVLLAGDAVHTMPPIGGYGASLGVQDVENMAWKLALVDRGAAGADLLASYSSERIPVAEVTTRHLVESYLNGRQEGGKKVTILPHHRLNFGYTYPSGAFQPEPGEQVTMEDPTQPSGRPGTRAPHVVLDKGGTPMSTVDLFDRSFTVLTAEPDGRWRRAASTASDRLGIDIACHHIAEHGDLRDADGTFLTRYGVGTEGASLVRPDGVVAWRTDTAVADPGQALVDVLGSLLHPRTPATVEVRA